MMRGRLDTDDILHAIIAEAEVALHTMNFRPQIEHIHRAIGIMEERIKRWEAEQQWSDLDRLMAKVKDR